MGDVRDDVIQVKEIYTKALTINAVDTGSLSLASGVNVTCSSNSGNKVATANTQKLGFWGATPIVTPTVTCTQTNLGTLSGSIVALFNNLSSMGLIKAVLVA